MQGINPEPIVNAHILAANSEVYLLSKPSAPSLPISSMPKLNNMVWGLGKGRIVIVAGRTAMGKSGFMTQLGWDLGAAGVKTIYLSLEMPKEELHIRCFCRNYKVNNQDIEHGQFAQHQAKYKQFINEHKNIKLSYSDCIGSSWKDIDKMLNEMQEKQPQAIIIDHINHIKSGGANDKAMLDDYLENIHKIAKKSGITFIIGAQINRVASTENKSRPEMHYLKGTGKLEEIADLAFLLHWPYYYDDNKEPNDYEIIVGKHRYGNTGIHKCKFYPQYSLFQDNDEQYKKPLKIIKEKDINWRGDND